MTLNQIAATRANLEKLRISVEVAAQEIVLNTFPAKISHLSALLSLDRSAALTCDTTGPPRKKRKLDEQEHEDTTTVRAELAVSTSQRYLLSSLAAQKKTQTVHEIVKTEAEQLSVFMDDVKLWVILSTPQVDESSEDEVLVHEEILSELQRAQESAINLRDASRQHDLTRAKICSKVMKYPQIEDYALVLQGHDENQTFIARQHISDIRLIYVVLTDLLTKWMENS